MSSLIPLQAVPNQAFTITLDGLVWDITLQTIGVSTIVSVSRDDVVLFQGLRVVAGSPLIPYRYQEAGNFIFTTVDDAFPFYQEFGVTQSLLYFTAAELETLRGGT